MLSVPQFVRPGGPAPIVVTYTNADNNDMVAPLLTITSTNPNVLFSTPDDPNIYVQSAEVLAVAPTGPAGILRPGQSGQLTLTLLSNDTINNDMIPMQVGQIEAGPDHRLGVARDRRSSRSTCRPRPGMSSGAT